MGLKLRGNGQGERVIFIEFMCTSIFKGNFQGPLRPQSAQLIRSEMFGVYDGQRTRNVSQSVICPSNNNNNIYIFIIMVARNYTAIITDFCFDSAFQRGFAKWQFCVETPLGLVFIPAETTISLIFYSTFGYF